MKRLAAFAILVLALPPLKGAEQAEQPLSFDYGFEQRVRNEQWDNILDFNSALADRRNQIRYRTRLWMKAPLSSTIDLHVGLNQETNQVIETRQPYRLDEIVFDTLYLDFKRLFVKGLSLRIGRQNLMRGDGVMLFEGNAYDGSRSIYFNAVNLAYSWKKSKLELIGISNPARDRYLPRIHSRNKMLTEWDERAVGLYYTDANRARTTFESYYFYKTERHDIRPVSHPQFQPDRHVHTAGGRAVRTLAPGWTGTGEFALQWGRQQPGREILGWGGFGVVKKTFAGPRKPYASLGYFAFSGDDPATADRIEGWDPLFGRWPKWSELYIYTQWKEYGAAYWTNAAFLQAEAGYSPWKYLNGRVTYYHMNSFHPFRGNPALFAAGTGRGNHYQARLDFNSGKHWAAHVLYERHLPGSFYASRDAGYFLRFEISYLLRGSVPVGRR